MYIKNTHIPIIITVFMLTLLRCTSDKLSPVDQEAECASIEATYDLNIQPIINNSCALGGCHVNGGDGPGDYMVYQNMIPYFEDGSFERTVIEQKDDPILGMPPDWSNNGAPLDLTEAELELVKCWVSAGYPEN